MHITDYIEKHAFDVVRVAGSSEYNYANPVRRDTVSTGSSSDNVTIRFTTDNPGPWILHWCVFNTIMSFPTLIHSIATLTGISQRK